MAKKKTEEEQAAEATPKYQPGVVSDRRVLVRPMGRAEREARANESKDAAAENPNAPKPKPQNEYKPKLVQMRRRHKGQEKKTPGFMSEIKI